MLYRGLYRDYIPLFPTKNQEVRGQGVFGCRVRGFTSGVLFGGP